MEIQTDSERVRHTRKMVLEFLGSSVDLSTGARRAAGYIERYGADPARYGPPAPPRRGRRARRPRARPPPRRRRRRPQAADRRSSRSRSTTTSTSATTRSASSATSASRPAARTPRTRSRSPSPAAASTPGSRPSETSPLPEVGVRLLRQLHRRLPDRRADVQVRARHARRRDLGRVRPDGDRDDLPVLRRRLRARPPRPGQHDREGQFAARLVGHRRPPLHQGPLRLRVRPEPRARGGWPGA